MPERPLIAFTLGDVAGIGPEVALRAAVDDRIQSMCRPVLVGPIRFAERASEMTDWMGELKIIEHWGEAPTDSSQLGVIDIPLTGPVETHVESAAAGKAAYDAICLSCDAALSHEVEAIVTAPINKYSLRMAGIEVPGHTEILADRCHASNHAMMLYLPPGTSAGDYGLGVAHVTLHTSIASVPAMVTRSAIESKIELVDTFLQRLGCDSPRIGVAALNPHAGEQGLFGVEEAEVIAPAVRDANAGSFHAVGPVPADALFRRAIGGEFDGVVAMYHDQGHIALKLIGMDEAVNITLGLPIVRTSPSHGTAFDIAWSGAADASGMIAAAEVASKLAIDRRPHSFAGNR